MKNIGVRMINIDFYPLLGGAQMHTLRLCRYLKAHGVDVEVITRHHPGLAYEEEVDGIPVYRTPILHQSKAGASLSFMFFALKRLITTRKKFQIIHSHEMLSPMTIGLLGREILGTRLVINPHRGGYLGDMYKLQKRRQTTGKFRLSWASRRGDAFISVSKEISKELEGGGIPSDKIHLIPYVLDTEHFKPVSLEERAALRIQLGLSGDTYACYTGRLVPEKGLDLLLQAWAQIIQTGSAAKLILVGDGDQRQNLEGIVKKLDLTSHVTFTGAVPDTAPYLQACDIYVQPSFTEGLPISMLEAMSCSLPVLATTVGGATDLIRDHQNGLLIPPHDVDSLHNCLADLVANSNLRKQLGDQARQDVNDYCAIEKIGQAHLNLYQKLCDL
jgi:glycosyltransferase involved in cell wall biosynthesis